jgi:Phospholipase_D-nuclease N-terminal/Short C-terminal domain
VNCVVFGADYPFLEVVWTLIVIFAWVIWFWLLITVFADLFRRHDIGGGKKAVWIIFVILVPFVGVLIYLIANSHSMAERNEKQMRQTQAQTDAYIQSVAGSGGPTAEIERAKGLLDSGAISQAEFDAIKAKALAG